MNDTDELRKAMVSDINNQVQSLDPDMERERLEEEHGQVWDTEELTSDFEVRGFMASFCMVKRKADGVFGSIAFQDRPRFYFNFVADSF